MELNFDFFQKIHNFCDNETRRNLSFIDRRFYAFSLLSKQTIQLTLFHVSILERFEIFKNSISHLLLDNCFLPFSIQLTQLESLHLRNFTIDNHFIHFISSIAKLVPNLSALSFSNLDWSTVSVDFKTILLERYSLLRWYSISESIAKWYTNDFGQLSIHARNHIELFRCSVSLAKTICLFKNLKKLEIANCPYLGCAWKPLTRSGDPLQTFWALLFQLIPQSVEELVILNSGLYDETFLGIPPQIFNVKKIDFSKNQITDFGLELFLVNNVGNVCELIVDDNPIAMKSTRLLRALENLGGLRVCGTREDTTDWEMLDSVSPMKVTTEAGWINADDEEEDSDFQESGNDESSTDQSMSSGFASEGSDLLKLLHDE